VFHGESVLSRTNFKTVDSHLTVRARFTLQLTVSRSVGLSVSPSCHRGPSGTHDQILSRCQTITALVVKGHPL